MIDPEVRPDEVPSSDGAQRSGGRLLAWLKRHFLLYDPRIDNSYSAFYSYRSTAADFAEDPIGTTALIILAFIAIYIIIRIRHWLGV